jgi:predicted MFS family arabinose efflux permease
MLVISTVLLADRRFTDNKGGRHGNNPNTEQVSVTEQIMTIRQVTGSWRFVATFLGYLLLYTPVYIVLVYIVELTESLALSSAVGVVAVSSIGGANIFGKIISGSLADWSGLLPVLSVCGLCISLSTAALPFATGRTLVMFLALGFGLGYGGSGALVSPLVANNYSIANANTVFGIVMASFAISGSVMPFLTGLTYDLTGTYMYAFVVSGGLGLCGIFLILYANYWQ